MSRRKRRTFTAKFKTRVALEAIKERKTLSALASEYDITPAQITSWKKQLLESLPEVFGSDAASLQKQHEQLTDQLYRKKPNRMGRPREVDFRQILDAL